MTADVMVSVEGLRHLAMPATNLALFNLALLIRLTRAGAHEALLVDGAGQVQRSGIQVTTSATEIAASTAPHCNWNPGKTIRSTRSKTAKPAAFLAKPNLTNRNQ